MRFFKFNEPDNYNNNVIITVSEYWIREKYYPYWQTQIEKKYGEDADNFTFEHCIDDFCIVNYAWEVYP